MRSATRCSHLNGVRCVCSTSKFQRPSNMESSTSPDPASSESWRSEPRRLALSCVRCVLCAHSCSVSGSPLVPRVEAPEMGRNDGHVKFLHVADPSDWALLVGGSHNY